MPLYTNSESISFLPKAGIRSEVQCALGRTLNPQSPKAQIPKPESRKPRPYCSKLPKLEVSYVVMIAVVSK